MMGPLAPEDRYERVSRLTEEFGDMLAEFIVFNDLSPAESIKREVLIRNFLIQGGSTTKAVTILLERSVDNDKLEKEFKRSFLDEFDSEIVDVIVSDKLSLDEVVQRANLTRTYLLKGGSPFTVLEILGSQLDNSKLEKAYESSLELQSDALFFRLKNKQDYSYSEEAIQVNINGIKELSVENLLESRQAVLEFISKNPELKAVYEVNLIAIDTVLKEKLDERLIVHEESSTPNGVEIWVYGRSYLLKDNLALNWISNLVEGFKNSSYLNNREKGLKFKVILHNRMSKDIASTSGQSNLITINLEEYQIKRFSTGQMMGLLAHEIGVHSLEATTLSQKELNDEQSIAAQMHVGKHEGDIFSVGKIAESRRQQDDHLTIGRGVLGQSQSQPRLSMYENTVISFIEASQGNLEQQKEIAAAYCIDIARIIVLNDIADLSSKSSFGKLKVAVKIARVAVNEWERIKRKYRPNRTLEAIQINTLYIGLCLNKLKGLVEAVQDKPSYL